MLPDGACAAGGARSRRRERWHMGMPGDPSRTRKDAVISSEEEPWRSSRHSVGTPDGTSRGQRHEEGVDRRQSSQQPARLRGERERSTLRRRQATLGGRSGGPEMAGIERGSSMTSQAPAVEASTGRRLERRAARSSSMGRVGASLGASGATGERPQEGPLQGRRRGASVGVAAPAFPASTGFIASTAFPASTSAACEGTSWPTSQSPQLASDDSEEPSAMSASTATIPQERRSRDSKCWDAGRMAVCTLPGSGWVEATRPETPSRQSSPLGDRSPALPEESIDRPVAFKHFFRLAPRRRGRRWAKGDLVRSLQRDAGGQSGDAGRVGTRQERGR